LSTALLAQAHPGHDGHELTWDMQHLGQHPTATLAWALLLGGAAYIVSRGLAAFADIVARSRVRVQRRRD
jgi:hypothetical protein